jgi:hypothetical protein
MYNQIDPRAGASTQRGGVISNAGQDSIFTGRNLQGYDMPGQDYSQMHQAAMSNSIPNPQIQVGYNTYNLGRFLKR